MWHGLPSKMAQKLVTLNQYIRAKYIDSQIKCIFLKWSIFYQATWWLTTSELVTAVC